MRKLFKVVLVLIVFAMLFISGNAIRSEADDCFDHDGDPTTPALCIP